MSCWNGSFPAEDEAPTTIHKAMRYSVFAGGKRVRPILALASGQSLGGDREVLLHLGAAIEMMHTYSLIHDDLPALDNDDLRRGSPTCHKVFGEAIAILAGDALMTRCYQVLADLPKIQDSVKVRIISEIACCHRHNRRNDRGTGGRSGIRRQIDQSGNTGIYPSLQNRRSLDRLCAVRSPWLQMRILRNCTC